MQRKKHQRRLQGGGDCSPTGPGCLWVSEKAQKAALKAASQSRSWSGSKRTAKGEKGLCLNQSLHPTRGSIYMQTRSRSCDVPCEDAARYSRRVRNKMALPSHSSTLPLLLLSLQWNDDEREHCFSPLLAPVSPETPGGDSAEDTSTRHKHLLCVHPAEHLPLAQITLTKISIFIKSPKPSSRQFHSLSA